jgi:hypothetical protein
MSPLVDASKTFNANEAMAKRADRQVVIGEQTLKPIKITSKVMKGILTRKGPGDDFKWLTKEEYDSLTADERKTYDAQVEEVQAEQIDDLYLQLSEMLVREDGEHPPVDFLHEELDVEAVNEIIEWLTPDEETTGKGTA